MASENQTGWKAAKNDKTVRLSKMMTTSRLKPLR